MYIESVKPRSHYRHYSNPSCQGTLMQQSSNWPVPDEKREWFSDCNHYGSFDRSVGAFDQICGWNRKEESDKPVRVPVPAELKISSAYMDRMQEWDYKKFNLAWKNNLSHGFDSPPDELIAFAKEYFGLDVVAVRTTYYYNVATGFDCPVIEFLYKE